MPKLTPAALAITLLAVLMPGMARAEERPRVVAVNYALAYFAERLGGDDIAVEFPVPAGTDPSFWRPGIADISRIQSADLILLNGAGFATWTTKASLPRSRIVNTGRGIADRLIVTETITHSHGDGGEHSHEGIASYTWLDPDLAAEQAEAIAGALAAKGLVGREEVFARLASLQDDLAALSEELDALETLAGDAPLIATHPRYQYLARAADLDIRALEWEAGADPDAAQLAALAALVEETGARVLLWEAPVSDKAREAVQTLGVADTVFPPLATVPGTDDFVAAYHAALDALGETLAE